MTAVQDHPTVAPAGPRTPEAHGSVGPPARPPVDEAVGPTALPRLLAGPAGSDRTAHERLWGRLPRRRGRDLVAEVGAAGLRGRGGAGFPTATKMAEVARHGGLRRTPVVVANGIESEPVSSKDEVLLQLSPHLVIDGMVAAAQAVGADVALLCVKEGSLVTPALQHTLVARGGRDPVRLELAAVPARYLAGQESALTRWLTCGRLLPTPSPPRPSEQGVDRRPTLVDNVETLANVAVVARRGAAWWRSLGTSGEPGTSLVTIGGAVERPGVREVATGTQLTEILAAAGAGQSTGVLLGGYFGTWIRPDQVAGLTWDRASLFGVGAAPGAGALAVLPVGCCPLVESARVLRWLAGQSAGQCGPCVHGLPAIAGAMEAVARGDGDGRAYRQLERWVLQVQGRGACQLPDGAVAFALSSLRAFDHHVREHRARPCRGVGHPPVLPTPPTAPAEPVRLTRSGRRAP